LQFTLQRAASLQCNNNIPVSKRRPAFKKAVFPPVYIAANYPVPAVPKKGRKESRKESERAVKGKRRKVLLSRATQGNGSRQNMKRLHCLTWEKNYRGWKNGR